MPLIQQVVTISELLLAALLSMLIGLDRERRQRPAGMRTHMLVGIGSCLFTVLSIYAFEGADTGRVASNIVTGVGFLGAGTIIQRKTDVLDLTTAASIWATAAVGMAVGAGLWFVAIVSALVIWTVLAILRRFEDKDRA
jgi:putative Mg2+ transporter-C (MgtC) family protein